jgi:hypothetical protein
MPHAITVVSLREAEIAEMTIFKYAEAFEGFDLPEGIPG